MDAKSVICIIREARKNERKRFNHEFIADDVNLDENKVVCYNKKTRLGEVMKHGIYTLACPYRVQSSGWIKQNQRMCETGKGAWYG